MNAEIVARLESSFRPSNDNDLTIKMLNTEIERLANELHTLRAASMPVLRKISGTVEDQVREVMGQQNISFEDALLLMTTRGLAMQEAVPVVVVQVAKGTTLPEAKAILSTLNEYTPPDAHVFYDQAENIESTRLLATEGDKAALFKKNKSSKSG